MALKQKKNKNGETTKHLPSSVKSIQRMQSKVALGYLYAGEGLILPHLVWLFQKPWSLCLRFSLKDMGVSPSALSSESSFSVTEMKAKADTTLARCFSRTFLIEISQQSGEKSITSSSSLTGSEQKSARVTQPEWDKLGFDPGLFNTQQTVFYG